MNYLKESLVETNTLSRKDIVFSKLKDLCSKISYGNTLQMVSDDSGGHRDASLILEAHLEKAFPIRVQCCYQTINVGVPVKIKDYPERALEQIRQKDEIHYGCPHHYELSEDKTKILYVRHGTNGFGETQGRYVEKEIKDLFLEASFSKEEISSLPYNSLDTYHESTVQGILLAAEACKVLYY